MSDGSLLLYAAASSITVANAYYIHPIIATIADQFGISHAMIGIVPSLNQIALAVGIFLLLPLGDRFSNRSLVLLFSACQVVTLLVMAVSPVFWTFFVASTVMGFFTIAPYLIPAYVSKRIPLSRLGHSTAILTAGVLFGVLFARAGAGVVSEYLGWRVVYLIGAALMFLVTILLSIIMEKRRTTDSVPRKHLPYPRLILSVVTVMRTYPEILISGTIQGLGFGTFLAIWMGLGLHLTSEEMGYGTDVVGYLAALTLFNLILTPQFGKVADRIGARRARFYFTSVYVVGVTLFFFVGHNLWLLLIPIFITNTVGPSVDVTNRMTFLSQPAEVRTRLMTIYIVCMFLGGGLASWGGTVAYDLGGWQGSSGLALALAIILWSLSAITYRLKGR
ncbi:MAG: MFS transporter [Ponticaulis sp.]|nr:MFS transporter [Ponticaulis sp.]